MYCIKILQCDLNKAVIWCILANRQEIPTTCDAGKKNGEEHEKLHNFNKNE